MTGSPARRTGYWRSGSSQRHARGGRAGGGIALERRPRRRARTGGCTPCGRRRSCSGPVRWGVSDENTTTPPAPTSAATASGCSRRHSKPSGSTKWWRSVPARWTPGATCGQPFVDGRVGERDPQREVLLRLDERVPVVLVPREATRLLGLLVDRLVPVEAHVGPDRGRRTGRRSAGGRRASRSVCERATRCGLNVSAPLSEIVKRSPACERRNASVCASIGVDLLDDARRARRGRARRRRRRSRRGRTARPARSSSARNGPAWSCHRKDAVPRVQLERRRRRTSGARR